MDFPPHHDVTVGDLLTRLSTDRPHADALVYAGGPRYTFRTLEQEARTIARGLLAIGVEPGERVVLWATNVPEWIVLEFALAKIGAILVPAHTSLRAPDILHVIRKSEAATIVSQSGFSGLDYVATLNQIAASSDSGSTLRRLVHLGDKTPPGFIPYAHLLERAAQIDESALKARSEAVSLDDVIIIQFTSGTTGVPKGVMLSSRGVVNNASALGDGLGLTPADRLCLSVPLFHAFGSIVGVLSCYTHGACLCPIPYFEPRRMLETIQGERCTALYGVPTMFLAALASEDFQRYDLTSLRTGVMAGSSCPEALMHRVMSEMHLPEMTIAYGLTEASPAITHTPRHASIERRTSTVGPALPGVETRIVDPASGRTVAPGGRGELCVRGYNVTRGYYNDPDATRAAIDSAGWLHTGDEVTVDDDGWFRITGRIKELIIRGGENIAPAEIENCLREHPGVADACAYGLPDAFLGEVVGASVRLTADHEKTHDVTGERLVTWCRERLARFKVPASIRVVSELPITPSGKIQRSGLRVAHLQTLEVPQKHLRVTGHEVRTESGELEFVGAVSDITAAKLAEDQIRRGEREFREIVNAIPQLIVALAPSGEVLYVNDAVLEFSGLSVADVIDGSRLFHPDDFTALKEERKRGLRRGVPFEHDVRTRRRDGVYRWFTVHNKPLRDEQGRIVRWYATGTDIDDRKRAEDRIKNENLVLREEVSRASMFEEIVGSSKALNDVLRQVSQVAPTDSTVLVSGETGTGKELVARAIHKKSTRSAAAFVSVNCAAIPAALMASELFGHERGAFTGAFQRRAGRFELADGGTIFLDEVGELSAETQVALLRVLQERQFERVGGSQPIRVDVRIIAATNRDLGAAVADKSFRADLFYRLNVFPVEVPALRKRRADIPLLVEYFIHRFARRAGKRLTGISKETLELLQAYSWPGNIRELQNVVERAVIVAEGGTLVVDERWLVKSEAAGRVVTSPLDIDLVAHERARIEVALTESRGRVSGPTGAAARLGIPRSTLESKIRSLGVDKHRFRTA